MAECKCCKKGQDPFCTFIQDFGLAHLNTIPSLHGLPDLGWRFAGRTLGKEEDRIMPYRPHSKAAISSRESI